MNAQERVYRTADGDLVPEGNERAAFLAYAVGDEITKADEAALKKRAAPANKQRRAPATKAASDKPASDPAASDQADGDQADGDQADTADASDDAEGDGDGDEAGTA